MYDLTGLCIGYPNGVFCREIESFALFVACLCHDIDHRGTTNSYQVASGSALASLYSSEGSVLEVSCNYSNTVEIKLI